MTLSLRQDRTLIRAAARSRRYLLADISAPVAPRRSGRLPVNVALVLDRSGSMGGEKIRLARHAVAHALALLAPDDRFSLVVYDDQVDVIVGSTLATAEAKRHALQRLGEVDARGSTDLAGGWQAGAEQVLAHLGANSVGRCLLVTDGLANVGLVEPDALAARARELKERGVSTSTFGVGRDFDEHVLQGIAASGAGHFYFIEAPAQIPDLLASELGETLEIVARDAALVLELPDGVEALPLGAFPHDSAGRILRVNVGHLVSGQEVRVVIKVVLPAGQAAQTVGVDLRLTDADAALDPSARTVTWRYATLDEVNHERRDRVVDRAVAEVYAAQARQQALALNREGRFAEARRVLERVARRIRVYAGDDPELSQLVNGLFGEIELYGASMDQLDAKRRHFAAYAVMQTRSMEGKSRRRE